MAMVEDTQVRNYRPTFLIDRDGVERRYDGASPVPDGAQSGFGVFHRLLSSGAASCYEGQC